MDNWMRDLPSNVKQKPLQKLFIPGSHNSCTAALSLDHPVAIDQPSALQQLDPTMGRAIRTVTHAWGKCQGLTVAEQLSAGIRYLDLRLAKYRNQIVTLHGLYGPPMEEVLLEVLEFSTEHPGEVIILDANHFFAMDKDDHEKTIEMFLALLSEALVPKDFSARSLLEIQDAGYRFILFYQVDHLKSMDPAVRAKIWDKSMIISPWTQKTTKSDAIFEHQWKCALQKRPPDQLCVSQFILSYDFDPKVLLKNVTTTLEKQSAKFSVDLASWFPKIEDKSCFNIISRDFVDSHFAKMVIDCNL